MRRATTMQMQFTIQAPPQRSPGYYTAVSAEWLAKRAAKRAARLAVVVRAGTEASRRVAELARAGTPWKAEG